MSQSNKSGEFANARTAKFIKPELDFSDTVFGESVEMS